MDAGTYIYPTVRLIEEYSDSVYFIDVANISSKYEDEAKIPDCVVVITLYAMEKESNDGFTYNGQNYTNIIQLSERCYVYEQ